MLRIVRDAHVHAELARALARRLLAQQQLEQRRLAGAVGAHQGDAVAAVEREVGVLVERLAAKALGETFELDDHIAGTRRVGELEVHVLVALGQDHELAFDLLDAAHALLGLSRLGGLVAELIHEHLHVGDLALLGRALGAHLLEVVLALLEIRAVVARIGGDAAVLERRDVVHAGVHEGAVVGDDEHGALIGGDEAAQPLDAFEVEVVRRLVQKQDVRVAQEQLGERDAHLPAAGELRAGLIEIRGLETQAGENLARVALELVPAQTLETVLDVAVLIEKGARDVPALPRLGDFQLQLLSALAHRFDLDGGVHDLLDDGRIGGEFGLLLQISHVRVLGERDRPGIGAVDAHDDLEQRGLTRAVGPHKRVALARVDLQRGAREERACAK